MSQPQEGCALDHADGGPLEVEAVALLLGLTGERVRQIEAAAREKLRRRSLVRELHEQATELVQERGGHWSDVEEGVEGDERRGPLTEEEVESILPALEGGETKAAIARRLGVTHQTVRVWVIEMRRRASLSSPSSSLSQEEEEGDGSGDGEGTAEAEAAEGENGE